MYTLNRVLDITKNRKPDFNNLLAVLNKKIPSRPTLFEFFLNSPLYMKLAGLESPGKKPQTDEERTACEIKAFRNAGYDYANIHASEFTFRHLNNRHGKASISANEAVEITGRESYENFKWNEPADFYDGRLEKCEKYLDDGMKFTVFGPGGVLENIIELVGFDNLCFMLIDDPELLGLIADDVGRRLYDYYAQIVNYDCVGAVISNDDWGFNSQTMLPPGDMRKFIFKWHKKIVELAHNAGKPVILHSCGQLETVFSDIIDVLKFDGKHSYEDKILPVEEAYKIFKGKIAVLGGLDMDYVCREEKAHIYNRAKKMLEMTNCEGYALGTGNSVPDYLPDENYFAMILAALDCR
jgi:uroporphyrinogen decarboxylase